MNLKGIGKNQRDLITYLQCYPDRYIHYEWRRGVGVYICILDSEGHDWDTIHHNTLESLVNRKILVQIDFRRKPSIEIITYKLNSITNL